MKCPNCSTEMEKGMIAGDGQHWLSEKGLTGGLNKLVNPGMGNPRIWAWRCPKCKKIELVSD